MTIDCNNVFTVLEILTSKNIIFHRGSRLYNTNSKNSDYDFGVVVPDDYDFIDISVEYNEKSDTRIHNCTPVPITSDNENIVYADVQIVKNSDFIDMINEHTPFALEAIFSSKTMKIASYKSYFNLDKWKLREKFSAVSQNSWAKAHKKMTVEKDIDMYCGAKSLFHSIRLQKLACQIASENETIDFSECNDLWNEIQTDLKSNNDWDFFNNKYKEIFNNAHSEMVKLCPKPEEKYKTSEKKTRKKKEE